MSLYKPINRTLSNASLLLCDSNYWIERKRHISLAVCIAKSHTRDVTYILFQKVWLKSTKPFFLMFSFISSFLAIFYVSGSC